MKALSILPIFLLLVILSCSDDDSNDKKTPLITQEKLTGRWDVSSSGAKANDLEDYMFFEFDGNHFYVGVTGTVIIDEYTILNDSTIELANFGVITVSSIEENGINFTLILQNTGESITIFASKASEVSVSAKTQLFSNRWMIVGGYDYKGNPLDNPQLGIVYLSDAGSYIVDSMNGHVTAGYWVWSDSDETIICSFSDPNGGCDENGENQITITELTETKMVMFSDGLYWVHESMDTQD